MRNMTYSDIKLLDASLATRVWDVAEYCRRAGIQEAEERRLIMMLGRYASCHELQMNLVDRPTRVR